MSGTINLRGNPVSLATLAGLMPLEAASKKYVDEQVSGAVGITEAPKDSSVYGRANGGWAQTVAKSGGDASATVVTASGSTVARTAAARFADIMTAKDFGATLDGTTSDDAGLQAIRTATSNLGVARVGPGTVHVASAWPVPTTGTAALWKLENLSHGTGYFFAGTDTVEDFNGSKWLYRTQSVPLQKSVLRVDGTVSHTGGTAGNVIATLEVNTTVPVAAATVNESIWGFRSVITSSALASSGGMVAIAGYGIRLVNGREVWGGNLSAQDNSGLSSSATGPLVGTELNVRANGLDDGGAATARVPAGAGIRVGLDVVGQVSASGTDPLELGWGVRVGSGNNGGTDGWVKRGMSVNAAYSIAAFDASLGLQMTGANAFRMAEGQTFGVDGTTNARSLGYASGQFSYTVSGSAVLGITDTGHVGIGGAGKAGVGLAILSSTSVGVDTSQATLSGPAVRIAIGQTIALDANGTHTLSVVSGTPNKLVYAVSGVAKFSIDDSGNVRAAGTITGSVTP